jgi:hypothetical protein
VKNTVTGKLYLREYVSVVSQKKSPSRVAQCANLCKFCCCEPRNFVQAVTLVTSILEVFGCDLVIASVKIKFITCKR